MDHDDPNWNIFRIRKQNGNNILTLKHKASDRSRDNYEYETLINNDEEMIKILNRLGYKRDIGIIKNRRITHYKDLELCLDDIESLGSFVEVEKITSLDNNIDEIQKNLKIGFMTATILL